MTTDKKRSCGQHCCETKSLRTSPLVLEGLHISKVRMVICSVNFAGGASFADLEAAELKQYF